MDRLVRFFDRPLNVGVTTVALLGGLHVAGMLTLPVGAAVLVVGVLGLGRSLTRGQ